ncbi:hypothetical protein H2201_009174, partial [Coniosporium apollinis]
QYSDINSPSLLPHVHNTAIPTKKADLALATSAHAPTRPLLRPQMAETSVSRLALPACVEVGEPGKSYLEASLQLGVWCFAGLEKLRELRALSGKLAQQMPTPGSTDEEVEAAAEGTEEPGDELPLFGWTAIGMDWKLHVAFRDKADGGVVVLGPLDSGGLGSVLPFFKLLRTVAALAAWAKDTY